MARITLVTPVFPKLSETFIVNKFVGLLGAGHDVSIVTQHLDLDAWAHFPQLAAQTEILRRIRASQSPKGHIVLLALVLLLQLASQTPYRACVYILRGFREIRWSVFRSFFRDLPVIITKPDIVHFEFGSLAVDRAHIGRWLGCRVVTSFRGYDLNYVGLESAEHYQDVWRSADAVHCLGSDLWKRAVRRGCPESKPHALIPPAIDTNLFSTEVQRDARPAGALDRPLRILSVGRIEWKKGHEYGLAAVRNLLDRGVAVEYRIVGTGEYLEAVMFCRSQLGLTREVTMIGAASPAQVKKHLEWADVFLHAAVSEGFCNAVLEAQAMRLAVVTSDADGLSENVENNVTGFVVGRRNPNALADCLETLARDGDLRVRMGAAGRARVAAHFQLPAQIASFDALYRAALATN